MKDAFDIIKHLMKEAKEDAISYHYLYGHIPNSNLIHYVAVECNGGLYFFNHVTSAYSREITTTEFINIIHFDQDQYEKQGWL